MLSGKIVTVHRNTPNLGARSRVCTVFRLLCYFQSLVRGWKSGNHTYPFALQQTSCMKMNNGKNSKMA